MPTVLLLQARASCEALSFLLEDEGVDVVHLPLLEVDWPDDARALVAAAESIGRYRWLAPDSPSAVRAFLEATRVANSRRSLGQVRWLAAEKSTARAIERAGWLSQLVENGESCCHPDLPHSNSAWASLAHGLIGTCQRL